MNAAKRAEIFRRLHEDNPEPRTELAYTTPFELLIAVILSAQATDVGVNKATARLYPVANTPEAIAYLPRRQPHRHSTGKERSGGGEETAEVRAARVPARCPPLADPAWPLRLQGAQAAMRKLSDRGPVRIQAQDFRRLINYSKSYLYD